MSGQCQRCGAALPPPGAPDSAFVVCAYCQTANPVPEAMRIRPSPPATPVTTAGRSAGPWLAVGLGVPVVTLAIVGIAIFAGTSHQSSESPAPAANDPQSLTRVSQALAKRESDGCNYVVTSPQNVASKYSTTLDMKAGGSCLHVLASAPPTETLDVRIVTPTSKTLTARAQAGQVVDLEHCPDESGSSSLDVTTTPAGPLAVALVDCAPEREKHRDDPARNGLTRVSHRLEALRAKGCREVLFAPKTITDEQSFTATLVPGAGCAVVVAASGSDANPLTAELRTPLGRIAAKPDPASEIQIVYCAATSGPHPLTIRPKTDDYYTMGAVNCPRAP